jgi:hypothetical protein
MNDLSSQLRKAGAWIWNQKEKMILVALILVLCYRVWGVMNPPEVNFEESARGANPPKPRQILKDPPPPVPVLPRSPDFKGLVRTNPFTVHSALPGSREGEAREERPNLTVVRIVPWTGGEYRAEIITQGARPKRYKEGEQFESYRLVDIDEINNQVTIFSNAHNKNFVITANEAMKTR